MKITSLLALACMLLSACGTTETFDLRTADLTKATSGQLCEAYGVRSTRPQEVKAELVRRNQFTPSEWELIDDRRIVAGMSECAVFAVYPADLVDEEEYKDSSHKVVGKDLWFSCKEARVPFCPGTRFEIRNGLVRSIIRAEEP